MIILCKEGERRKGRREGRNARELSPFERRRGRRTRKEKEGAPDRVGKKAGDMNGTDRREHCNVSRASQKHEAHASTFKNPSQENGLRKKKAREKSCRRII
jgi:transposase InsO family protein